MTLFLTTKDLRTANTYFVVSKGPGARAFADWPLVGTVEPAVQPRFSSRQCSAI